MIHPRGTAFPAAEPARKPSVATECTTGRFRRNRQRTLRVCLMSFLCLWAVILSPVTASARQLFRIGTGGLTGVYYPIGKILAQGLTGVMEGKSGQETGLAGIIAVAQNSAGSIENIQAVATGKIEAGLAQADVAAAAFRKGREFAGEDNVRAIRAVASLYPEKLQIVTRRDAGVFGIGDFRGKRISIDEAGSGTLSVMRIVLQDQGLSERDFTPVYLKPVFTQDKMITGELQGFALMAGVPAEAVTRLSDIRPRLVPVSPDAASRIHARHPYLVPGVIAAGIYPDVADTPTLQVHALLIVHAAMPEDLAYRVTALIWNARMQAMLKGHPQGAAISRSRALDGMSIPLHPGAARYYREAGLSTREPPPP